jgi:hypothetical protein
MTVYVLHITPAFGHAKHYVGFCEEADPSRRLNRHLAGRGSPLIKAAVAAGCRIDLVHTIPQADRNYERSLKKRGGASRWCPACRSEPMICKEAA